jgi:hypothetical protein
MTQLADKANLVDWECGGYVQWRLLPRKRSREVLVFLYLLSLLGFVCFLGIQYETDCHARPKNTQRKAAVV